jgi:hsp70-interacting protein
LLTLTLQDGPPAPPVSIPLNIRPNFPAPLPNEVEINTNGLTSRSIAAAGILKDLLRSIVSPVPHGLDGDAEPDVDLEEKSIKVVLACVRLSVKPLEPDERELLEKALAKFGEVKALERWGLTQDEWNDLEEATK